MYLNQFSVRVVGGKEVSGSYVELEHGRKYSLALRNDRDVECDAYVEVDGKHVGTWRVWARQTLNLERPAHDQGCFTFYQVGTREAAQAGLQEGHPNLGLVKVTFTPAKKRVKPLVEEPSTVFYGGDFTIGTGHFPVDDCAWAGDGQTKTFSANSAVSYRSAQAMPQSFNASNVSHSEAVNYAAGGTGLSGLSLQSFTTVDAVDPDLSQQTVIHLRLVAKKQETVRPLTSYSTPLPPPVS